MIYVGFPITDVKSYIANIPSVQTKEQLLSALKKNLNFPDYYCQSWDALYDCLCDFNWIKDKRIVIYHRGILLLDAKDIEIYLAVLNDAISIWHRDGSKELDVYFSVENSNIINKYLHIQ